MIEVQGIYQNGHIELEGEIITPEPVKVNVTFLENIEFEKNYCLFQSFRLLRAADYFRIIKDHSVRRL